MGKLVENTRKRRLEQLETAGNEIHGTGGRKELFYRKCVEIVDRLGEAELQRRAAFINRATEDLGLYADRLSPTPDSTGGFSMDLFPRILRPAEWEILVQGIRQRARAFSAYIRDIYNGKAILREGILPIELVFEDPCFYRELHGVPVPEHPVTIGAVDLVRSREGEWQVLENRFSTPTGISYVIQIRRIMAQALPELFEQLPVFPVASFATRLSEALAGQARPATGEQPLVVLLSEGESGRHFFEESFLARHMGIPLVRPGDVIVREGRVYLRTVNGLHQITVIYRRMEPEQLDPVAFSTGDEAGIPGLIQCVRRGTVHLCNAPGCAVADNRALLAFSDKIIRYYTGERPILRTVPTWHGFDVDQKAYIEDHLGSLTLKTACHPEMLRRSHAHEYDLLREGRFGDILKADPRLVVAQQIPETSRVPAFDGHGFSLHPVALRVFFISGPRPYVLPGGLTRLLQPGHENITVDRRYHALKDTWTVREKQPTSGRSGRLEPELSTPPPPLTSRAAETFYWIGRYLERGCSTARMINTLSELRWGELTPRERELYAPLLRAVIEATGQKVRGRDRLRDLHSFAVPLLFEEKNPASVRSCLASVRLNASGIRSFITPEFWRSILRASALLEKVPSRQRRSIGLRETLEEAISRMDGLYGTGHRTLLHDAGWQFLNIGLFLERAVNHVVIMATVLTHIAERQWQHLRDDSDLTALLRLLGALDAYHRRYRSRAYLDRVAQLLWQSPACTSSILFAIRSIAAALASLHPENNPSPAAAGLGREVDRFAQWLEALRLERVFPARTVELDRGLTRANAATRETVMQAEACLLHMREFLEGLHGRLEDTYFSHHPEPPKPN